jgi:hypothetical protein
MSQKVTTVDDLVVKLRNARCEMRDKRLMARVSYGAWEVDSDSDSDSDDERRPLPISTMKNKTKKPEHDRNDVFSALAYCNSNLCIGINSLTTEHMSENNISNILFDLANMPLAMVLDRLKKEGAQIE